MKNEVLDMQRDTAENLLMDFCYIWEQFVENMRKNHYDYEIAQHYIKTKNKILDEMTNDERWER